MNQIRFPTSSEIGTEHGDPQQNGDVEKKNGPEKQFPEQPHASAPVPVKKSQKGARVHWLHLGFLAVHTARPWSTIR